MNIFAIYEDPVLAAKHLCDRHVVKMTLESAQLLCNAHWKMSSVINDIPYKALPKPYEYNPTVPWTYKNLGNYDWLIEHSVALCAEYTARYNKVHKCQEVIEWCQKNKPTRLQEGDRTAFAIAIKEHLRQKCIISNDPIQSYRRYYVLDKHKFATWKRNKPDWWDQLKSELMPT